MEFVTQTHENRRFSVNHHTRVPQIQATSSLIVRLAPVMLTGMAQPARYRAVMVQTHNLGLQIKMCKTTFLGP